MQRGDLFPPPRGSREPLMATPPGRTAPSASARAGWPLVGEGDQATVIAALPRRHGRWGALAVALLLVGTACSRGGSTEGPTGGSASNLAAQVASYDLAAGSPSRFLVGLWTKDGGVVTGGKVQMRFFYLGTRGGP